MKGVNTSALLFDSSLFDNFLRFDVFEGIGGIKKLILQNKTGIILSEKGEAWRVDLSSLFTLISKKKLRSFFESTHTFPTKREITNISVIKDVTCNSNVIFALSNLGHVYSWGKDPMQTGILGLGDMTYVYNPTLISSIAQINQITLSDNHAAALDGNLYTWGTGAYGELCHQNITMLDEPLLVKGPQFLLCQNVVCHKNITCILTNGGHIQIYGSLNPREYRDEAIIMGPRLIQNLPQGFIKTMSFGDNFVILLTHRGDIYVLSESFICQKLHFPLHFKVISAKYDKIFAITNDSNFLVEWTYKVNLTSVVHTSKIFGNTNLTRISKVLDEYKANLTFQSYQTFGGTIFLFDSYHEDVIESKEILNIHSPKEGKIGIKMIKNIGKKESISSIQIPMRDQIGFDLPLQSNFGKFDSLKKQERDQTLENFLNLKYDNENRFSKSPLSLILLQSQHKKPPKSPIFDKNELFEHFSNERAENNKFFKETKCDTKINSHLESLNKKQKNLERIETLRKKFYHSINEKENDENYKIFLDSFKSKASSGLEEKFNKNKEDIEDEKKMIQTKPFEIIETQQTPLNTEEVEAEFYLSTEGLEETNFRNNMDTLCSNHEHNDYGNAFMHNSDGKEIESFHLYPSEKFREDLQKSDSNGANLLPFQKYIEEKENVNPQEKSSFHSFKKENTKEIDKSFDLKAYFQEKREIGETLFSDHLASKNSIQPKNCQETNFQLTKENELEILTSIEENKLAFSRVGFTEEEVEVGQTRTYFKNPTHIQACKLILKEGPNEDEFKREELVSYEEIPKVQKAQFLVANKEVQNGRMISPLLKSNTKRIVKEEVWIYESAPEYKIVTQITGNNNAKENITPNKIYQNSSNFTDHNISKFQHDIIQGVIKNEQENKQQFDQALLIYQTQRKKRSCSLFVRNIQNIYLGLLDYCFERVLYYSLHSSNKETRKLERMFIHFDKISEEFKGWKKYCSMEVFKELPSQLNLKSKDQEFTVQLSQILHFGKIIQNHLNDIFKDFFLRLHSYNARKKILEKKKRILMNLQKIISKIKMQYKFQSFHLIKVFVIMAKNQQQNKKEQVPKLVKIIFKTFILKNLNFGLNHLKLFSKNTKFVQNCFSMLETKLKISHQNKKRSFLDKLKFELKLRKMKYPYLALNLTEKIKMQKQKNLIWAFKSLEIYSNQIKTSYIIKMRTQLNFLQSIFSKFIFKTKKEAFNKIVENNRTFISETRRVHCISLWDILVERHQQNLKSGFNRIRKLYQFKVNQHISRQIKKTVLKHFVMTLSLKVVAYYKEFINALLINQTQAINDDNNKFKQNNFKITILSQKLHQFLQRRKIAAFMKIRGIKNDQKKSRSQAVRFYTLAYIFEKLKISQLKAAFHIFHENTFYKLSSQVLEIDNDVAKGKKVLSEVDVNKPQFESATRRNIEADSPHFRYLEESSPKGAIAKKFIFDSSEKDHDQENFSREADHSFGDLSKLLSERYRFNESRERRSKDLKENNQLVLTKQETFAEIQDSKENLPKLPALSISSSSQTLSLAANSPSVQNIMDDSGNKGNRPLVDSERKPSFFSMSGTSLKIGHLMEGSPKQKEKIMITGNQYERYTSETKVEKDDSKPRISYLLRNNDIGFRVQDDNHDITSGKDQNKAEYLIAELGSSFKFYSLKDKNQLITNPNESMEKFKIGQDDSRITEEYAEPLELETKAMVNFMQDSHFEIRDIVLSSTNRNHSQSEQQKESLVGPNHSQPPSKEYIYTKFLPKPPNLKNDVKKPKSCLKKPHSNEQSAITKKKPSVSIREDRVPSPINNTSNSSSRSKPKEKNGQPAIKKKSNEKKISSRSISPIISDFTSAPTPINKQTRTQKENVSKSSHKKIPIYPYTNIKDQTLKETSNEINKVEVVNQISKHKEIKGLQIEIPATLDEQIISPTSSMMSQIEHRLLNEEKYGTLYSIYKDKNKEKASALLELYKGTQSAKASSSKHFSLTSNFSNVRQDFNNSFRSVSPH